MDNFCTQCGNPLNGKDKCDKCGHVAYNSVIDKISDTVKNYDYKGKAAEIKKQTDKFVDKAKEYDYKGKAEEIKEKTGKIVDKAKKYDYKAKGINKKAVLSLICVCIVLAATIATMNHSDDKKTDNIVNKTQQELNVQTDSSKWVAGVALDSSRPEINKILEAFDTNIIYAGLSSRYSLLEIIFKDNVLRVKSPSFKWLITTSDKANTYVVEVEGDYKIARDTSLTSHKSLKFYVTKSSDGIYTQEAANYETETFLAGAAAFFNN